MVSWRERKEGRVSYERWEAVGEEERGAGRQRERRKKRGRDACMCACMFGPYICMKKIFKN